MSSYTNKPGYMRRATIAWALYNVIFLGTLAVLIYFTGPYLDRWYVMIPLIVVLIVGQWIILGETIMPFIRDWIQNGNHVEPIKPN
jgi:MFS superfamily sulfate permease-like transporter